MRNSSSYQPLNAEDCYKLQSVVSILAPYGIVNKYLYEVQIGVLFEPLTVLMTDLQDKDSERTECIISSSHIASLVIFK